jgi:hypothetical protein
MTARYLIKVAHRRAEKTIWRRVGTLFFNPAEGTHKANIRCLFDSLPPIGHDCKAFPPEGQAPLACPARFTLTVTRPSGEDKVRYHSVGTAFHNPPRGEHPENFHILLDSYPLAHDVTGYPALAAEREADAAEPLAS